jgi:hypothetical protein
VERLAEKYSLHEPIGAPQARETAPSDGASPGERRFRHEDIEGICANPLRDEPHPAVVGAVKHFGLVGLVACALGAALLRWRKSPPRPTNR